MDGKGPDEMYMYVSSLHIQVHGQPVWQPVETECDHQ